MRPIQIKIACLEDSEFYNMLICRYLQSYMDPIAEYYDCRIEILSFSNPNDFLRNLGDDTNIALLDYYLGPRLNAEQVIQQMRKQGFQGKIIMLSQAMDERVHARSFNAGISEFIVKDRGALQRTALVIETMVYEQLKSA